MVRIMKKIVFFLAASVIMACSEETEDRDSSVTMDVPTVAWQQGRMTSRGMAEDFNNMVPATTVQPQSIGVWGWGGTGFSQSSGATVTEIANSEFTYNAADKHYHHGSWNATTGSASDEAYYWGTGDYSFYAYAPYTSTAASFDKTTLTLSVPEIGATDYVIANKVRSHNPATNTSIVPFIESGYSFRHIYACVQLAFAIEEKYAKLRYIDIKNVVMSVPGNGTATFTYDTSTQTASWGTAGTTDQMLTVKPHDGMPWKLGDMVGHAPGKYHSFALVYLRERLCEECPVTLEVTYDVYDLYNVKTRQNAVAKSTITFGKDVTTTEGGKKCFKAGYYYNLLVNIVPDYLYVMDDNDNGADGTIVVNE